MALIRRETMCNGCPECVGCGRDLLKTDVFRCDQCGEEFYEGNGKEIDGQDLCWSCVDERESEEEEDE